MISLFEVAGREMIWDLGEGPDWTSVLRADREEVARLRFEEESGAVGEVEGRRWVLHRMGPAFHSGVEVRAQDSPETVAAFKPQWAGGGGVVEFQSGVRYCWNPSHIWSTTYCFRRESKTASVCISQTAEARIGPRVRVCEEAARQSETPILVLLGGFLAITRLKWLMELAEV